MTNNTKSIYYWAPFTSRVATVSAVINSARSINKFDKGINFKSYIIDAVNEWNEFEEDIKNKNIQIIKLGNDSIFNKINKDGFIRSRLAYWYIFLKSFFPLKSLIKKNQPDFLIIHLITSLPLILFFLFSFKTKLILRVSGYPKMNFFRKFIWKISSKKIFKITTPTKSTYYKLKKYDFLKSKIEILKDPIINLENIREKLKVTENIPKDIINFIQDKNFYVSVGRLTRQKNFLFLIECINKSLSLNANNKFLIIGRGEQKKIIEQKILHYKLDHQIKILDYTNNIYFFLERAKGFILTSLWEDPGFVLIEAAYKNCSIISSDCPNGPREIVGEDGGYLFSSNSIVSFLQTFKLFENETFDNKKIKKIDVKKKILDYTSFRHYLSLKKILESI
jgi:glycosyltransferase involved in cell wall biosynthesis